MFNLFNVIDLEFSSIALFRLSLLSKTLVCFLQSENELVSSSLLVIRKFYRHVIFPWLNNMALFCHGSFIHVIFDAKIISVENHTGIIPTGWSTSKSVSLVNDFLRTNWRVMTRLLQMIMNCSDHLLKWRLHFSSCPAIADELQRLSPTYKMMDKNYTYSRWQMKKLSHHL